MKKNSIQLNKEQRGYLEKLIKTGQEQAWTIEHAHILLKADSGPYGPRWSDRQIHEAFNVAESTVLRVRRRFQDFGLEHALKRSPQPPRPDKRKLTGEQEARLIALLCSSPPDGRERWSLRLISKRIVELEIVDNVSYETVRQVLKKTNSSPGSSRRGVFQRKPMPILSITWKMSWRCTIDLMMNAFHKSAWMREANTW